MQIISVKDAANSKGCSRQTIWNAIKKGDIDGTQIGRSYVIEANQKFEKWQPNPNRIIGGKKTQSKK